MMNTAKPYLFVLLMLAMQSCLFHSDDCDPNIVCNTDFPDSGYVDVHVSDLGSTGVVPITIYKGDVEDNEIVIQDTLYGITENYYYLPSRQKYSGKALYRKNGITTQVFDSDKIKIRRFWNCDERCYEVNDASLDLKLD